MVEFQRRGIPHDFKLKTSGNTNILSDANFIRLAGEKKQNDISIKFARYKSSFTEKKQTSSRPILANVTQHKPRLSGIVHNISRISQKGDDKINLNDRKKGNYDINIEHDKDIGRKQVKSIVGTNFTSELAVRKQDQKNSTNRVRRKNSSTEKKQIEIKKDTDGFSSDWKKEKIYTIFARQKVSLNGKKEDRNIDTDPGRQKSQEFPRWKGNSGGEKKDKKVDTDPDGQKNKYFSHQKSSLRGEKQEKNIETNFAHSNRRLRRDDGFDAYKAYLSYLSRRGHSSLSILRQRSDIQACDSTGSTSKALARKLTLKSLFDIKTRTWVPAFHMNTYRLTSQRPFNTELVGKILAQTLNSNLDGVEYDEIESPNTAHQMCDIIYNSVREFKFDRYKLIAIVRICQKLSQTVRMITGFLWDAEQDNYSLATFENNSLNAVAIVYGVYKD
ncbi:uncharacterized protein [Periplaneta americana]|uniref:uncharacterized protein n=1 Tax=Periplaneta americana TaxID=6978 RepID=UPI0037E9C990